MSAVTTHLHPVPFASVREITGEKLQSRKSLSGEQSDSERILCLCKVLPSLAPKKSKRMLQDHHSQKAEDPLEEKAGMGVYGSSWSMSPLPSQSYPPHKPEQILRPTGHSLEMGASCRSVTPVKEASPEESAGDHNCVRNQVGAALLHLGTVL